MKTLLIDNGSSHIIELYSLLANHIMISDVQKINKTSLNKNFINNFDFYVLSGAPNCPVVNNPRLYAEEINLIKNSKKPILGVCMGFEIICYAFGSVLERMDNPESGIIEINVTGHSDIFNQVERFQVYESHRWVVKLLKQPLKELAASNFGVEAVKHFTKPIWGFQFHPEVMIEKNQGTDIFNSLIKNLNTNHF